uniref:Uncharacterized protein n=1 Tax=Arundo donax TaxID=35708 RepID=A0A0A8YK91_ARUDO
MSLSVLMLLFVIFGAHE